MAELSFAKRTRKRSFSYHSPNDKCGPTSEFGCKSSESYVKNRVALSGTIWHSWKGLQCQLARVGAKFARA
jgi:hypothetical protein